jgi:hypothetical protein
MNYKELIVEAANAENWDEVIKLGTDAKLNSSEETIFGIKRGYVNFFRCSRPHYYKEIMDGLDSYGYKCFNYRLDCTKEFVNENYVVLFANEEASIEVFKQGFQIKFFDIKHRNAYTDKKKFYVDSDTQKFRFSKFSDLKGTLREQQIDSILDD